MLCLEYLYLRAITGSADGKLRIWNILNGECLRVVRGNSQCDAIKSLSLTNTAGGPSRLLINTDNAILLMEFEKVEYDYSSHPYLNTTATTVSDIQSKSDDREPLGKNKKRNNYPYIRASRSELVATPNVKLFTNDKRINIAVAPLEHSARPISSKNLKDARLLHQVTSSQYVNASTNSLGHISDLALLKRQVLVNSINSTLQVSNKRTTF